MRKRTAFSGASRVCKNNTSLILAGSGKLNGVMRIENINSEFPE